jgi:alkanesulfonate monooxygenase SsuD/methylene tetrahydromethanopterin reductase-like flavin-dependent oxidoreductase (luciferase family)
VGVGERQTLRIVAKYADACTLFGSAETVKRKLSVLKEHCRNVGRDYDSILKKQTWGCSNWGRRIGKEKISADHKHASEQVNEFVIYGTPEDVIRQIELLEEAGIQYLIVDLDPSKELEALEMFANEIIKKS